MSAETGEDDLLESIAPESEMPAHEAIDDARAAVACLDHEVSRRTLRRIYEAVSEWYDYLVARRLATVNPVSGLEQTYTWDDAGDEPSNPALDADAVSALYEATETSREELVVVALCA